uniref:Uncharacterized protein n=1 Tax=Sphaerodactylus townsendi TaxID=933632 RepID=A0ACB8G7M1_9SAUR
MLLSLLLLAGLWGSLAQKDLERKAFVFPEASKTAHVVLKPTMRRPLTSFTLCMRFHSALTCGYSLFSYATKRNPNAILLFVKKPNRFDFYLGGKAVPSRLHQTMSTAMLGGTSA